MKRRLRLRRAKPEPLPEPEPVTHAWSLDEVVAQLRADALPEPKPMTFDVPPEGFTAFGTVKFERIGDDPTTVQPIMWNDGIHPARRWP